jgi:hypothetical protein
MLPNTIQYWARSKNQYYVNNKFGDYMDILEEAKKLMIEAGCEKAYAVYKMDLCGLAEVRSCNENGESIEIEKSINELVPTIQQKLEFDPEKPIECPLNSSMDKYLEFILKTKTIIPCNLKDNEFKKLKEKLNSLLTQYNWTIQKRN